MTENTLTLAQLEARALADLPFSREEALALEHFPLEDLLAASARITKARASRRFNFCAIVNAKAGRCSENCRWCAQSRFAAAGTSPEYGLLSKNKILEAARKTEAAGISRFSLVTAGRKLSRRELREACEAIRELRSETRLEICASFGLMEKDEWAQLKAAGLTRVHCNLETGPAYFEKVCTSHKIENKIATLRAARDAGLTLCSGGILGLGESFADRVDLALTLRELEIESIPLNRLVAIEGTALAGTPELPDEDFLRAVALFRFTNPRATLRFAGGRLTMSERLVEKALAAGVNGEIAGDLLTTPGVAVANERKRVLAAGYTVDDLEEFDRRHLWHPYDGMPGDLERPLVERAQGVKLKLADGREVIDGTSAWWCAAHGFGVPAIVDAISKQAQDLAHVAFGGLTHDPAVRAGRALLRHLPAPLDRIFFSDSGSVAVEIAMKMALQYARAKGYEKRNTIAAVAGGYHGDTWNAMSVTDPAGMHAFWGESLPRRRFVPAPPIAMDEPWDEASLLPLRELLASDTDVAGLILEPVFQGASGMRFYHPMWLAGAAKLCREADVLLIADEIATGFWRTGTRFACDRAGVVPDVMTLGKALSGGAVSAAATVTSAKVADAITSAAPHAFLHGPTYMANPIACAAIAASLAHFETYDAAGAVARIEKRLKSGLAPALAMPGVKDVRVLGAVGVVECEKPVDRTVFTRFALKHGVWARPFANFAYLMPAFVMTEDDLAALTGGFLTALEAALTHARAEAQPGHV